MKWLDRKGWKTAICSSLLLRLGFLVLLTIGITSCWYPLFNLDVAVGEQLVGKLGAPQFIFSGSHNFYHGEQYTFIPIRLSEPIQGLAVSERNPREQFVWDIFNSNFLSSFRLEIQNYTPGPPVFPITFDHFNSTDPVVYVPVVFDNQLNIGFRRLMDQIFLTLDSDPNDLPRVATGITIEPNVILNPTLSSTLMVLDYDISNPLNPLLHLKQETVNPGSDPDVTLFGQAGLALLYNQEILGVVETGFIGKYPADILGFAESYLFSGKMADNSIKSFGWFSNGIFEGLQPTFLPGVSTQISTILSTGELLSILDEQLIIYSPLGESNFVISNGNVRFVHERYDQTSGRWVSVFTRNLRSQDTLLFEVYEYPTSRLKDLAIP